MRTFLILLLLLVSLFTQAQYAVTGPTPPIFRHLFNYKGEIPHIATHSLFHVIPAHLLSEQHRMQKHYLVKTGKSLIAGVDGTGILFELKDSAGLLTFHRLDLTHNYGNTNDALNFCFRDTIYSLGGYGFWRTNGQLRYFHTVTKEWSLIKLNREVPMRNVTGWLDVTKGFLYVYATYPINQSIQTPELVQSKGKTKTLYMLDMQKETWYTLGSMIRIFDEPAEHINTANVFLGGIHFNVASLGHFVKTSNINVYIDDFRENKRWRAKRQFYKKYDAELSFTPVISYFIDSILYTSGAKMEKIDSIIVSRSDFQLTDEKVYETGTVNENLNSTFLISAAWLLGGTMLGFLLFAGLSILKRHKQKSNTGNQTQSEAKTFEKTDDTPIASSLFDEVETELIRFILSRCFNHDTAYVPEINKILGLAGKNGPVQKKNRSEKINRINEKWRQAAATDEDLILRKRSEFDKRIFEYYIQPDSFARINRLL